MTNKGLEEKNPHICTPLTGKTSVEIVDQLEKILTQKPDLIEWRADFFTDLADVNLVLHIVKKVKSITTIPLLFTIRAEHEGGEKISMTEEEKIRILTEVCEKTDVNMIDYETSNQEKYVQTVSKVAKETEKTLILSYHSFTSTPPNEKMIEMAKKAESYGADIAKFAVMPQTKDDVFRLLEVTRVIDNTLEIPVITMSMGELGGLSRIIGWAYGSIVTFGVGVELSAPGQIPVEKLREAIEKTQQLLPSWK